MAGGGGRGTERGVAAEALLRPWCLGCRSALQGQRGGLASGRFGLERRKAGGGCAAARCPAEQDKYSPGPNYKAAAPAAFPSPRSPPPPSPPAPAFPSKGAGTGGSTGGGHPGPGEQGSPAGSPGRSAGPEAGAQRGAGGDRSPPAHRPARGADLRGRGPSAPPRGGGGCRSVRAPPWALRSVFLAATVCGVLRLIFFPVKPLSLQMRDRRAGDGAEKPRPHGRRLQSGTFPQRRQPKSRTKT